MKTADRQKVYDKCGGRCGYCGNIIALKKMQVDHISPMRRGDKDDRLKEWNIERGTNKIENLMPACARCNRWKSTFTIEQFRNEIAQQHERLYKYAAGYRLLIDMGLLPEPHLVTFYFETLKTTYSNEA